RLVAAVKHHRFGIRDAGERRWRNRPVFTELLKHTGQHGLDSGEHIVLCDKAHFDVELIKFARTAIRAAILITKARRDLKITVEARNHDELLELLRRLWQRIKLARVQTRRHEEIPRAFRT